EEITGYDIVIYSRDNEKILKKTFISSSQKDTIEVVNFEYSKNGNLILQTWRKKGKLVYFKTYDYDNYGNLVNTHCKNTSLDSRLEFEDYYFKYDSSNNKVEWKRYDGTTKTPYFYYYNYDSKGLMTSHKNSWME